MKFLFSLILTSLIVNNAKSQTGVFETFKDYQTGEMKIMDTSYIKWKEGDLGYAITFLDMNGQNVKYKTKDIWGFYFRGYFFRTDGKRLGMLLDTGKLNFFMNGYAGLDIVTHDTKTGIFLGNDEFHSFVSLDSISGELYPLPTTIRKSPEFKKMQDKYPEFDNFYDCIGKHSSYNEARRCVKDFNSWHQKRRKK